jgi:hypothetical protein
MSKQLIPIGDRWAHLQRRAWTFRNVGLGRNGIYTALKNFTVNHCEDGANYPDDKIQALADAIVELVPEPEPEPIFPPRPISREKAQNLEMAAWNKACREDRRSQ